VDLPDGFHVGVRILDRIFPCRFFETDCMTVRTVASYYHEQHDEQHPGRL
jgi:hypothetical protein